MKANDTERAALESEGFTYEYPGFWMKTVRDKEITIADGESVNGYMWEVQIMSHGECIAATEGFASVDDAIAMAIREVS
jgi:hypothetical protein